MSPALVIAWNLFGGASCAPRSAADRLVANAWKSFDDGKRREALQLFRDALGRFPDDGRVRRAYEDAMGDMGRYGDLKAEYAAALAAHRDQASAYFNLADIDDDYPEAKRLVSEGLRLDPAHAGLRWLDGLFEAAHLRAIGRAGDALAKLESIPPRIRDPLAYHSLKSTILFSTGRSSEGLAQADAMVQDDPHSSAGYLYRATIHYRTGDWDGVVRDARSAGSLGEFAAAHALLGAVSSNRGLIAEGREEFRKALRCPNDGAGWAVALMIAAWSLGDLKQAEKYGRLALRLNPEDTAQRAYFADLRRAAGDIDEAELLADSALQQNRIDGEAMRMMAHILAERRRYAEAATMYQKALELDPASLDALIGRILTLDYSGRCLEAKSVLGRAQALAPDSPDVARATGIVALCLGRYGDAVNAFHRVLGVLPHDRQSFVGIAEADYCLKQYERGRAVLRKGIAAVTTKDEKRQLRETIKAWDEYVRKRDARDSGQAAPPR